MTIVSQLSWILSLTQSVPYWKLKRDWNETKISLPPVSQRTKKDYTNASTCVCIKGGTRCRGVYPIRVQNYLCDRAVWVSHPSQYMFVLSFIEMHLTASQFDPDIMRQRVETCKIRPQTPREENLNSELSFCGRYSTLNQCRINTCSYLNDWIDNGSQNNISAPKTNQRRPRWTFIWLQFGWVSENIVVWVQINM